MEYKNNKLCVHINGLDYQESVSQSHITYTV